MRRIPVWAIGGLVCGPLATILLTLAIAAPAAHARSFGIFEHSGVLGVNCSACHSGPAGATSSFTMTPVNAVLPPISTGYVPGATYDVAVTVTGGPGVLYGFDWFASDPLEPNNPTPLGEGILTDAVNTQQQAGLPTYPEFVHTTAGNLLSSWAFQWKAPEGEGTVRIWLSGNSANGTGDPFGDSATPSISSDIDPIGPEVVARFGNVNGGLDDVVNVLMLNSSPGDDDRVEGASVGGSLVLSLQTYPGALPSIDYALYALLTENTPGDVTPIPMGVGDSAFCFILPDNKPLVRAVANSLGHKALLGCGRFNLPSGPGNLINTTVPGTVSGRKVTFQALVPDTTAAAMASVTNAIVMDVP